MNKIELKNKNASISIDLLGAWIENWKVDKQDIFLPKQVMKNGKTRGGCHVCYPNFDSGGETNLPHHGFGRISEWDAFEKTETSAKLKLQTPAEFKDYENVEAILEIELFPRSLRMLLKLRNNGESSVPIAPAFHPYYDLAVFKKDILTHKQENLPKTTLWSGKEADYICVEPSFNGFAFKKNEAKSFGPNETMEFALEIFIED